MPVIIRQGQSADFALLPAIEDAADQIFLSLPGFEDLLNCTNVSSIAANSKSGGLLIAEDAAPVGFAYFEQTDDCLYLEQLAVIPEAQKQGVGCALLDALWRFAQDRKLRGVTLCTFRNVPWNKPYYAKLGYRVLDAADMGPELSAHIAEDKKQWSRFDERVAMGRFFSN